MDEINNYRTTQVSVRLVYIMSASHSGSTLLAMLLGAHPRVCTAGELKMTSMGAIERYRCSCGAFIRECSFWRQVTESMRRRGQSFDLKDAGTDLRTGASPYVRRLLRPLHRGASVELLRDTALTISPAWRRNFPEICERNRTLAETILETSGAEIIVDSSKIALRLKYLLRDPFFDVKIIRLIRDGRGVALTYMRPGEYADAKDPRLRGQRNGECLSMDKAAREWRRSNEEAESLLSRVPNARWMEVRYESVCDNPTSTLSGVFSFLGLDATEWNGDFRNQDHHIVGNGMRLDATSEIRLDDRWRDALSADELAVFETEAGAMNRRYGYR